MLSGVRPVSVQVLEDVQFTSKALLGVVTNDGVKEDTLLGAARVRSTLDVEGISTDLVELKREGVVVGKFDGAGGRNLMRSKFFVVVGGLVVRVDGNEILEVTKLLPETRRGISSLTHGVNEAFYRAFDLVAWEFSAKKAHVIETEETTSVVAETVDKPRGGLLEVKAVGKNTHEEQVVNVGRLEVGFLGRKFTFMSNIRHAREVKNASVKGETSAVKNAVVVESFSLSHSVAVTDIHVERVVVLLGDIVHIGIQHGILRLELVCVQKVAVQGTHVSDVMGLPGKLDRARGEDVNESGRGNQFVSCLKSAVTFAKDKNTLVLKELGVNGHIRIVFHRIDSRNVRTEGSAVTRTVDQSIACEGFVLRVDVEHSVLLGNALHFSGVVDLDLEVLCIVAHVLDEPVSVREIVLVVRFEEGLLVAVLRFKKKRVPVPSQILFVVCLTSVNLVNRDKTAVAGEHIELSACVRLSLKDNIITLASAAVVSILQSCGTGADDDVEVMFRSFRVHCVEICAGR